MGIELPTKEEPIRCVYCLEIKPMPVKGEHIILKGLGGRATTLEVCGECNQFFGDNLDIEFLRHSRIALLRFYDPAVTDGQVGDKQFHGSEWGFWDSRVYNDGDVEILSQVAIIGTQWVAAVRMDKQDEIQKIIDSFVGVDTVFKETIDDIEHHHPPRAIITPRAKMHQIRGRTQADVDHVKAALKKGGGVPGAAKLLDIVGTEMLMRLSMDPNMVGRCVAKMAFNFATEVLDVDTMVQPSLNPVRAYIRGTDVRDVFITKLPNGQIDAQCDERYVDRWYGLPLSRPALPTAHHAIQLLVLDQSLGAYVALVGGVERFIVRLGPLDGVDSTRLPACITRREDDDYWLLGGHVIPDKQLKVTRAKTRNRTGHL